MENDDLISTAEAAELTGYTRQYISYLARHKLVMGRMIGNRWVVSRQSILEYKERKVKEETAGS